MERILLFGLENEINEANSYHSQHKDSSLYYVEADSFIQLEK